MMTSIAEYHALLAGEPKPPKYGNRKTVTPDGTFDSAWEAECWQQLRYREMAGEIHDLKRQVPIEIEVLYRLQTGAWVPRLVTYENGREMRYIADFSWQEDGVRRLGESKGFMTAAGSMKLALVRSMGHEVTVFLKEPKPKRTKRRKA